MTDVPQTMQLDFGGYWLKTTSLPAASGIYCVYACVDKPETVSIDKLLYIGESGDMRDRVTKHNLLETWKKQLTAGQVLCFSAAQVATNTTRKRAEAALIFKHKPPVNDEYTNSFPFDTTTINASGRTAKLTTSFTVKENATS